MKCCTNDASFTFTKGSKEIGKKVSTSMLMMLLPLKQAVKIFDLQPAMSEH